MPFRDVLTKVANIAVFVVTAAMATAASAAFSPDPYPIPDATVGANYTHNPGWSCPVPSTPHYLWQVPYDFVPGLLLQADGTISGIPTVAGTYLLPVAVSFSSDCGSVSGTYKLTVKASPPGPVSCSLRATPASLPIGGGQVRLTASCLPGATGYSWRGPGVEHATTAEVVVAITRTSTFTVNGWNGIFISAPASVTVVVAQPVPANAATAVAVEFHHAQFGHYFVTSFGDEIAALDSNPGSGWSRTGSAFRVFAEPGGDLQPVCRFFTEKFAPKSSHFYTPYAQECAKLKQEGLWQYEADAFYLQLPDAAGGCPRGTGALYRLYNNGVTGAPNHRYTSNVAVYQSMKAKGWTPEGHHATSVFACVPAGTAAAAGQVSGEVALGDAVRTLTEAQRAELLSATAERLEFAADVGIARGDVFVVPDVGAFVATGVSSSAGRHVIDVAAPSLDELFSKLSITARLDPAAGEANDTLDLQPKAATEAGLRSKKLSAVASVYKGERGVKLSWLVEVPCGAGGAKLEAVSASLGIYGDVTLALAKGQMSSAAVTATYIVPQIESRIGCKVKRNLARYKIGQWSIPLPGSYGFLRVDVPVFLRLNAETDITPVIGLGLANAEIKYAPGAGSQAPEVTVNGSLIDRNALILALAPSFGYSATAAVEIDPSLRLNAFGSYHLASLGVRAGPAAELTASIRVPSSDVCAKLTMPVKAYVEYRAGRDLTRRDVFDKTFDVARLVGNCGEGTVDKGLWEYRVQRDVMTPAGCAYPTIPVSRFVHEFAPDRSTFDVLEPSMPGVVLARFTRAAGSSLSYNGCRNASGSSAYVPDCSARFDVLFAADFTSGNHVREEESPDGQCRLRTETSIVRVP